MPKQRVLVDSCVIIEAFRIHCWTALCVHFEVETVERCVEECCTGDPLLPGRVPIARDELTSSLTRIHAVDRTMLAALALDREDLPAIDDGELHLMAWLHANSGTSVTTVISTADRDRRFTRQRGAESVRRASREAGLDAGARLPDR